MSTEVVDALFARARQKAAEAALRTGADVAEAPVGWCAEAAEPSVREAAPRRARTASPADDPSSAVGRRLAQRRSAPRRLPLPQGFASDVGMVTTSGYHPVESLRPGDALITSEQGVTRVVAVDRRRIGEEELGQFREIGPILIRAGALGPGLPARDIVVAPRQEVTFGRKGQPRQRRSAVSLIGHPGVLRLPVRSVTYHRLHVSDPALVQAEGVWLPVTR